MRDLRRGRKARTPSREEFDSSILIWEIGRAVWCRLRIRTVVQFRSCKAFRLASSPSVIGLVHS